MRMYLSRRLIRRQHLRQHIVFNQTVGTEPTNSLSTCLLTEFAGGELEGLRLRLPFSGLWFPFPACPELGRRARPGPLLKRRRLSGPSAGLFADEPPPKKETKSDHAQQHWCPSSDMIAIPYQRGAAVVRQLGGGRGGAPMRRGGRP